MLSTTTRSSIAMYSLIRGAVVRNVLRPCGGMRWGRSVPLSAAAPAGAEARLPSGAALTTTTCVWESRLASTLDTRTGAEKQSDEDGKRGKSDESLDRSAVPKVRQSDRAAAAAATTTAAAATVQRSPTRRTGTSRLAQLRNGTARGRAELTLEHFLLRDKGVKLWRDFLRATRNIANPAARRETIDWLRDEHFEGPSGLRHITDLSRIRDALMNGNVTLKRICGPMELASALNPTHGAFPKLIGRRVSS